MTSKQMLEALATNGGFSYNPTTGRANPRKGYMVSLPGYERKFTNPTEADIDAYVKGLRRMNRNMYIGGWVNEGITYLDLSIRMTKREAAEHIGRQHKQKAIYDCANQQDIVL